MKNYLIKSMLLGCIAITACKKDRTCECTTTVISETSTEPDYEFIPQAPIVSSTKYSKIKKNNLYMTTCVSSESTDSYNDYYYDNNTMKNSVVTRVSKTDCKIK